MRTKVAQKRGDLPRKGKDRSSTYFYLVIGCVMAAGIGFNAWSRFAAESPSMTTFLDLLTMRKTSFCSRDGAVLAHPDKPGEPPNCVDYDGYRIVEGDSVEIYELDQSDQGSSERYYARVAALDTTALKRLFNLKFVGRPSSPPPSRLW